MHDTTATTWTGATRWRIERVAHIARCRFPFEWRAASGLLADYATLLQEHVSGQVSEGELARLADEVARPEELYADPDRLVLAWHGRVPAAILAATVDDDTATLTRFFVRPLARGTGVAANLLDWVIHGLGADGVRLVVLDTFPVQVPAAVRLCSRHGFVPVGDAPGWPHATDAVVRMSLALGCGLDESTDRSPDMISGRELPSRSPDRT